MTHKQQLAATVSVEMDHTISMVSIPLDEHNAANEADQYLANVMTAHLLGHYVREQRVRYNGTLALQYDSALSYWASTSPFQL